MRKLFRFKYEPCNRTCYAYCQILMRELRKLADKDRQQLVNAMVQAHNHLCDNPEYSFGVDIDEKENIFVGHLRTPKSTDLFSGRDFDSTIYKTCNAVLNTQIPQVKGDCNFGDNGGESLGQEILKFCTDLGYAQIKESHCECKAHN